MPTFSKEQALKLLREFYCVFCNGQAIFEDLKANMPSIKNVELSPASIMS